MKAIVYHNYGSPDVLRCEEMEKPVAGNHDVLIEVRAASANALDWRLMRGKPSFARLLFGFGFFKPKEPRMGRDVAGKVEAVGKDVKQFKPGDEVFGVCLGAFAEYACNVEDKFALKPTNITFEAAAAVPVAGITALQGLRDKGCIQRGQKVLIVGASGGVGTFAVQIARAFGAEVTAICSTSNVDATRSMGADHVIDYTREDFTKNGQRYNLIFAANAYHSIFDYRRALTEDGIFVMAGGGLTQIFQAMLLGPILSRIGGKKIRSFTARINKKDLDVLKDLLESGKIVPVIDRRYPLKGAAEAIRYLEQGHARGKVVITLTR